MIDRVILIAGFYLAKQPFVEIATVVLAECNHGGDKRAKDKSFELTLLNNIHHRYKLYFPYETCSNHINISHLNGNKVKLYGRQWVLGFAYDSLVYPKNINID